MKKILFSIIVTACTLVSVSCDKGDGEMDYGNALIYLTQAMTNGTIDNLYAVPAGGDVYTYNFKVEANTVKVFLSVYRSGKLAGTEVSVDVAADLSATSAQAAALGAEPMPESMYSLPSSATVPAGENYTTFYLELQKSALSEASAAGKRYVLCVGIRNPSKYELYEPASQVVIDLDVDAMRSFI